MARILIIDDNVNLTTLLSKALAKFGYQPFVENNSILAVSTVRQVCPDLILLDVMMPEKDGGRVLADLRHDVLTRNIPVILLTALAREAQGLGNMDGIKSPVMGKPVDLKRLVAEIENELEASRPFNQSGQTQGQLPSPRPGNHHSPSQGNLPAANSSSLAIRPQGQHSPLPAPNGTQYPSSRLSAAPKTPMGTKEHGPFFSNIATPSSAETKTPGDSNAPNRENPYSG